MALIITQNRRVNTNNSFIVNGIVAFDSSYPTGGESFSLANIVLRDLDSIIFEETGVFSFQYDYVDNKVLVFTSAAAPKAEVANGTDLSALDAVRFTAFGV